MTSGSTMLLTTSASGSRGRRWHLRLAIVRMLMGTVPSYSLNRTRLLALKACGIRPGRATLFWGLPRLSGPGAVASRLHIGTYCGFNDGCEFDLEAPITIGDHVSVGHEVKFITSASRESGGSASPIIVEDGVWIGARCTLHAGVRVGAGAIIGAGSTVTEDVPPNFLVTGGKQIPLPKWR